MGRSKFPGKPPKTATRKRIKVLGQSEAAQGDPVTVAENIYYGLSLFNETFGDNEKVRRERRIVRLFVVWRSPFAIGAEVAVRSTEHCVALRCVASRRDATCRVSL